MFTYLSLGTHDLDRAIAFYDPVMQALGQHRCDTSTEDVDQWQGWAGWGRYEQHGLVELALWVGSGVPGIYKRALRKL